MAYIGLRVNHSTAGTDLGALLSKALTTDPSDTVALAKLQSDMLTADMQRKLLREQTTAATQEALGKAQANKIINYNQSLIDPAVAAADALARAIRGQPPVVAASEAPEVVSTGPVPVPVPAPRDVPAAPTDSGFVSSFPSRPDYVPRQEPAFNYPVSAFPLQSDTAPVPVEPQLPGMPLPLVGVPRDLIPPPKQPPLPPPLLGLPPELRGPQPDPSLPPMPPRLAGVPSDLVPRSTFSDVMNRLNNVSMPGEQAMNDWGRALLGGQAAAEPPVAINPSTPNAIVNALDTPSAAPPGPALPPSYFTPPAPLDLPPGPDPRQGPPASAVPSYFTPPAPLDIRPQDMPVTVQPPDTSALAGVPPELRANESINVPARNLVQPEPPVSLEAINPTAAIQTPTSVPTGPGLAPAPPPDPNAALKAGTGDILPAGAAVPPPQQLPGTVVGKDGGAQDGPGTVKTDVGTFTDEQVHAMNMYIFHSAKTPEEGMQAAQRFWGTVGATFNPDFGKDPTKTANIAALEGGGASPGGDSMAANLTKKPGDPSALLGTGIDAQDRNTLTRVNTQPTPATRDDAIQYELAYNNAFRTPHDYQYLDTNGNTRTGQRYNPAPLGIKTPEQVYQDAGIPLPKGATTAPAAGASNQAVVPATAASATTSPSAVTPAGAAGQAATPSVAASSDANTDPIVKSGANTQPTEPVLKDRNFYEQAKAANGEINGLDIKNAPSSRTVWLTDPNIGGGSGSGRVETGVNDMIAALASSPATKRFWHAATSFSAPILRKESGLATRPEDMKTIMTRYIGLSDDPPDVVKLKALSRDIAIDGLNRGAYQVDKNATDEQKLAEVNAYVDAKLAEIQKVQKNAAPDTAATTAPATGQPAEDPLLEKYAPRNKK